MKVKICGLTTLRDAQNAVEAGADMLGFNFYPPSPRYINPEDCATIVNSLRQFGVRVTTVGVFVNASLVEMARLLDACGLDLAQLHGDETPEMVTVLGKRAYKALRPKSAADLEEALSRYPECAKTPAFLVDAYRPDKYGGTGHTADWGLAQTLARQTPILLAGGLNPESVAAAVEQVRPWGVDVASGVESSPGSKDPQKMAAFVNAVRQAVREIPITIEPAKVGDAAEILALQELAYRSEAVLNQDFTVPPLTQTLAEIEAEFSRMLFLKAVADKHIVASVRAYSQDGTCHIGRLIVHPDWQNQGIGSRLMRAVEDHFDEAGRYELFTSEQSKRNIYLYQKLGYILFRQEKLNERMNLVYLEKVSKK